MDAMADESERSLRVTDPAGWSVLAEVVLKHAPCLPASHACVKKALGWVVVVGVCSCQLLAAVVVELQRALQAVVVQEGSACRVMTSNL